MTALPRRFATFAAVVVAVVVLGTALVGPASATGANRTASTLSVEPLISDRTYCTGQTVSVETTVERAADETYRLVRRNGTGATLTFEPDDSDEFVVNLSSLSPGEYVLHNESGTPMRLNESGTIAGPTTASRGAFRVRNCSFDVALSADSVGIEPLGRAFSITVRTNATDSVVVSMANVPPAMLAEMVNGTVTDDGVIVSVPEDGRIPVYSTRAFVCGPGTGAYTLTVATVATGQRETVSFSATAPEQAEAAFADSILEVDRGETVPIAITATDDALCWSNRNLRLQVVSDDVPFVLQTGFRDGDEDNALALSFDTGPGNATSATDFVTGIDNTTLVNPRLLRTPGVVPLPAGEYEMNLTANDSELAIGLLIVEPADASDGTTPATPTTFSSTTHTTTRTATPTAPTPSTDIPTSSSSPSSTAETGPGFGLGGTLLVLVGFVLALPLVYKQF